MTVISGIVADIFAKFIKIAQICRWGFSARILQILLQNLKQT